MNRRSFRRFIYHRLTVFKPMLTRWFFFSDKPKSHHTLDFDYPIVFYVDVNSTRTEHRLWYFHVPIIINLGNSLGVQQYLYCYSDRPRSETNVYVCENHNRPTAFVKFSHKCLVVRSERNVMSAQIQEAQAKYVLQLGGNVFSIRRLLV